ncbi:MAG: Fic family protein [Endomicrobia bacterium]|nr:Fic family protein [Endomicrobiia bacterium]
MNNKFNLTIEENIFLAKKMLVGSIYSSAKIEGVNTTFPETETILEGVNVPAAKLDDIITILNLRDAWREIFNTINEPLTLEYLLKINSFVSRNESLEWGSLRTGKVGISGTNYIPEIPDKTNVANDIIKISASALSAAEQALDIMLYIMRSQLFWDGNKRTAILSANKYLIINGGGILLINEEYIAGFNAKLTDFYNTNKPQELKKFLYENCILGIEK